MCVKCQIVFITRDNTKAVPQWRLSPGGFIAGAHVLGVLKTPSLISYRHSPHTLVCLCDLPFTEMRCGGAALQFQAYWFSFFFVQSESCVQADKKSKIIEMTSPKWKGSIKLFDDSRQAGPAATLLDRWRAAYSLSGVERNIWNHCGWIVEAIQ